MFREIEYHVHFKQSKRKSLRQSNEKFNSTEKGISLSVFRELFAFPLNLFAAFTMCNVRCWHACHKMPMSIFDAHFFLQHQNCHHHHAWAKKIFYSSVEPAHTIKHFCCDDKLRFIMIKTYMFSFLMLTNISITYTQFSSRCCVGPHPGPSRSMANSHMLNPSWTVNTQRKIWWWRRSKCVEMNERWIKKRYALHTHTHTLQIKYDLNDNAHRTCIYLLT